LKFLINSPSFSLDVFFTLSNTPFCLVTDMTGRRERHASRFTGASYLILFCFFVVVVVAFFEFRWIGHVRTHLPHQEKFPSQKNFSLSFCVFVFVGQHDDYQTRTVIPVSTLPYLSQPPRPVLCSIFLFLFLGIFCCLPSMWVCCTVEWGNLRHTYKHSFILAHTLLRYFEDDHFQQVSPPIRDPCVGRCDSLFPCYIFRGSKPARYTNALTRHEQKKLSREQGNIKKNSRGWL